MTEEERAERNKDQYRGSVARATPEQFENRRQANMAYMRANRTKFVEQNRLNAQERKRRLVDLFGGKCADCSGAFPVAVFHFHHVVPSTKNKEISNITSWEVLLEEAKKCIMLCANCHIIRHSDERETRVSDAGDDDAA